MGWLGGPLSDVSVTLRPERETMPCEFLQVSSVSPLTAPSLGGWGAYYGFFGDGWKPAAPSLASPRNYQPATPPPGRDADAGGQVREPREGRDPTATAPSPNPHPGRRARPGRSAGPGRGRASGRGASAAERGARGVRGALAREPQ